MFILSILNIIAKAAYSEEGTYSIVPVRHQELKLAFDGKTKNLVATKASGTDPIDIENKKNSYFQLKIDGDDNLFDFYTSLGKICYDEKGAFACTQGEVDNGEGESGFAIITTPNGLLLKGTNGKCLSLDPAESDNVLMGDCNKANDEKDSDLLLFDVDEVAKAPSYAAKYSYGTGGAASSSKYSYGSMSGPSSGFTTTRRTVRRTYKSY